ncbi:MULTISPECIES: oligopeptide/dipeptide ABC transporter ATP-binding protein [unclassified Roseitalea]|uniref:ABC transporter ATP-binding protein n=1 Tax=unclassified Roseitalea TaxID=2639107 RepID=UPI00273E2AE8|nr:MULTISPECIES: oligopeptide/dipeptide ABC transporter ATP-binding protein [unclassified Roseitalea]
MSASLAAGVPSETAPLLDVDDLTVHFGAVRAVEEVSFSLKRGETLGLVGESGSGKSTVGRAILQLTRPTGGSVRFEGAELTKLGPARLRPLRKRMQLIFQDPRGSLDPKMKVADILAEPMIIHRTHGAADRKERVAELLRIVGLGTNVLDRYPHQLSGGQAQRIAIGRALALDPALIVADEPISSLDVSIQAQVINLLSDLRASFNLSLLFIAHDLAVVRHISDRVAVMYLGRIVELADKRSLYVAPLHPYTRSLLSAVPIPDPRRERGRRRIILKGEVPSPDKPPAGCALSARCPLRANLGNPEDCTMTRPPLRQVRPGHSVACHFAETSASSAASGDAQPPH